MAERKPKTDAQKRAQKAYMSKFVEVKVRMTPAHRAEVQEHAAAQGESTTAFINRAIDNQMQRDNTPAGVDENKYRYSRRGGESNV